jgi:hypothetical protein
MRHARVYLSRLSYADCPIYCAVSAKRALILQSPPLISECICFQMHGQSWPRLRRNEIGVFLKALANSTGEVELTGKDE